jgi:hypothetical protein
VVANYDNYPSGYTDDNFNYDLPWSLPQYSYSCSVPPGSGPGNIEGGNVNLAFLDNIHIASISPCRGVGSALYSTGTDLDGEPWANPPSMGCDEVVLSNLVGPLSVSIQAYQTNLVVNHYGSFGGSITGRASRVEWSLGDGPTITNIGASTIHQWTSAGDYTVSFTAFNTDNPGGVSANLTVHVLPPYPPQLQSARVQTNNFIFQFTGQSSADYKVQYATNLTPPVTWQTLGSLYGSTGQVYQIQDPVVTNGARYYRVQAQ